MPVSMFHVYYISVSMSVNHFLNIFWKVYILLRHYTWKKMIPNTFRKKQLCQTGSFLPHFLPLFFALFSESCQKIFLKFFAMIGEYFKQVTRVNVWKKKTLIRPKRGDFNLDLAQKFICIVLGIHCNDFLEIFHDFPR